MAVAAWLLQREFGGLLAGAAPRRGRSQQNQLGESVERERSERPNQAMQRTASRVSFGCASGSFEGGVSLCHLLLHATLQPDSLGQAKGPQGSQIGPCSALANLAEIRHESGFRGRQLKKQVD